MDRAKGGARAARERGLGKSREMRLTQICCCCLLYQLGVLSNGIVAGKFFRDFGLAFPISPARDQERTGRWGWRNCAR